MAQPEYPGAPADGPSEDPAALRRWITQIARVVNRINGGKINATGTVTLVANAASTAVSDARATAFSCVGFMPATANAATELGNGTLYVAARANGAFTISHANNAQTDRAFVYSIVG